MANNYKELPPTQIDMAKFVAYLQEQLEKGNTDLNIDGTMWIKEDSCHCVIATNQPQM